MSKLNTPSGAMNANTISWSRIAHAQGYRIYKDGALYDTIVAPTGFSGASTQNMGDFNSDCTLRVFYDETEYEDIIITSDMEFTVYHVVAIQLCAGSSTTLDYTMGGTSGTLEASDDEPSEKLNLTQNFGIIIIKEEQLDPPMNINADGLIVKFDPVENAETYTIYAENGQGIKTRLGSVTPNEEDE